MFKKLIIFDTPEDFTHPLLSRTLKGNGFLIATVPDSTIKKIQSTLDFDMICMEDIDKPIDDCLRLRKNEFPDFKFDEKVEKIKSGEIDSKKEPENEDFIDFFHEKFIINTDTTAQVFLNSFTSPQILKIFQGSMIMSNTSRFIIHQNFIYTHYLDEVFLWGQIERGKYYFSNDDKFLVVRKTNSTILYDLETMETKTFPHSDRIVFGKDILVLDFTLIELKEGVKQFYEEIIEENTIKASVVDDWVDSNEEVELEEEKILLKQFQDIWFSPTEYEFIAVLNDKLTVFKCSKDEKVAKAVITRANISSEMIKEIQYTPKRCYAIIAKYINNKLKYFIESYSDTVTVTELTENMDLTFRFCEDSFIVGSGNTIQYYEFKNRRVVLVNTIEKICSPLVDLYKDYYCCVGLEDEIYFYKGKELIKKETKTFNNINSINFSPTGLFIAVYSQVQISFYDCMGNFVWNKICGDLRGFTFFELEEIPAQEKKTIQNLLKNNEDLVLNEFLGNKKNLNVKCFRKQEKTVEEKRKSWLRFLCAL